ncbi:hypothetical protein MRB53_041979 [Persea americana]|nr:hypothetical protein MRB53_041979 [Persea americana]
MGRRGRGRKGVLYVVWSGREVASTMDGLGHIKRSGRDLMNVLGRSSKFYAWPRTDFGIYGVPGYCIISSNGAGDDTPSAQDLMHVLRRILEDVVFLDDVVVLDDDGDGNVGDDEDEEEEEDMN